MSSTNQSHAAPGSARLRGAPARQPRRAGRHTRARSEVSLHQRGMVATVRCGPCGAKYLPHIVRDWRKGRIVFPHTTPEGHLVNLYGHAIGCIMAGCCPPRTERPCTRQCGASASERPLTSQRHPLADTPRLGCARIRSREEAPRCGWTRAAGRGRGLQGEVFLTERPRRNVVTDFYLPPAGGGVGDLVCWGAHGMDSLREYPLKNKHLGQYPQVAIMFTRRTFTTRLATGMPTSRCAHIHMESNRYA